MILWRYLNDYVSTNLQMKMLNCFKASIWLLAFINFGLQTSSKLVSSTVFFFTSERKTETPPCLQGQKWACVWRSTVCFPYCRENVHGRMIQNSWLWCDVLVDLLVSTNQKNNLLQASCAVRRQPWADVGSDPSSAPFWLWLWSMWFTSLLHIRDNPLLNNTYGAFQTVHGSAE